VRVCIGVSESDIGTERIWTDEYKDTVHVFLQRLNPGFVVALGFFPIKRPEPTSSAMKIAYHVRFSARIIGDRASFTRVVNYWLLPL
jgi:hypothetical protein